MKKSLVIFCSAVVVLSLTAFGYKNWNEAALGKKEARCSKTAVFDNTPLCATNEKPDIDLVYKVDSRYGNTITKEDLNKAKSIIDILPKRATERIVNYYSMNVSVLNGEQAPDQGERGMSELLTDAQIEVLKTVDYTTNIYVGSEYSQTNGETGILEDSYLTYYISIIPEKKAVYTGGQEALIDYLKRGSKEKAAIIKEDKLQPGKVSFTVSKEGAIENVSLTSTSGYASVDETLVDLISNIPGTWTPATNSKGEKVDQALVFFFGLEGC